MPPVRRDGFPPNMIDALAKRASFICSNPDCRSLTICPSESDPVRYIYIGIAAHITAASEGGPRFNSSMSPEERSSIDNAIFLCSNCARMIDTNNGIDFPKELLRRWREEHEEWCRRNLNKSIDSLIRVPEVLNPELELYLLNKDNVQCITITVSPTLSFAPDSKQELDSQSPPTLFSQMAKTATLVQEMMGGLSPKPIPKDLVPIKLELQNSGQTRAYNILILLEFPSECSLYEQNELDTGHHFLVNPPNRTVYGLHRDDESDNIAKATVKSLGNDRKISFDEIYVRFPAVEAEYTLQGTIIQDNYPSINTEFRVIVEPDWD